MRTFCIAKELALKGMIQTFAMIFQTHPKTRQNPLREILLVLRQNYTWIFPVIFLGFPGHFPGFLWASKIDSSTPEKTRKKSGKARENYRKNPCIFLAKYEKYLTERVLPSFRMCLKNDRKTLNHTFGGEFPSDVKISHQLTERGVGSEAGCPAFRRFDDLGITSETTRESRVRRPGSASMNPEPSSKQIQRRVSLESRDCIPWI